MSSRNLEHSETHFKFGENWASYARLIDQSRIDRAKDDLQRLVDVEELRGRSFLDIGSGSGLHSCAAAQLGVSRIFAVDIDPISEATTRNLLQEKAPDTEFETRIESVFDLSPDEIGLFDIVYSWGVLHHTGNLQKAVRKASNMVAPGGLLVVALYRRTGLDWAWKMEKRWYRSASPKWQRRTQWFYDRLHKVRRWVAGTKSSDLPRGMDYSHDVHDWLGGYPYETISPPELDQLMGECGFSRERVFAEEQGLGVFGSGCNEYVYRRSA